MLKKEEVLKIARLARLSLSESEVEFYQKRLGRVLEYVKDLESLKISGDAFVRHVPKDAVGFREDVAVRFEGTADLLTNSPAVEENCFLLPKIVEHSN